MYRNRDRMRGLGSFEMKQTFDALFIFFFGNTGIVDSSFSRDRCSFSHAQRRVRSLHMTRRRSLYVLAKNRSPAQYLRV